MDQYTKENTKMGSQMVLGDTFLQMEICMKEKLKRTHKMEKEHLKVLMDKCYMMEIGKTTESMVLVRKLWAMEVSMKEILKMALGMEKVSGHKITIGMKVISRIICLMDKEFMNIQMEENTKDLGLKESWMGMESFTSTMTESTQGIIWMINEKGKEEWSG